MVDWSWRFCATRRKDEMALAGAEPLTPAIFGLRLQKQTDTICIRWIVGQSDIDAYLPGVTVLLHHVREKTTIVSFMSSNWALFLNPRLPGTNLWERSLKPVIFKVLFGGV